MQEYQVAVDLLDGVLNRGRPLTFTGSSKVSPQCRQLCYGVLRDYFELVFYRDSLLAKRLPRKHADLNILLICGIYSIRSLDRPVHASVDEAVKASRGLKKAWASSLINGVLRSFLRQQQDLQRRARESAEARSNHPAWLEEMIRDAWPDRAEQIMAANNEQAPMILRVNQRQIDVDGYRQLLLDSGVGADPIPGAPWALKLKAAAPVESLPGFERGLVSVQDEASQLAAPLLESMPGDTVLDACAAPGGKTCHLLELEPGIRLLAIDKHSARITQLRENLERLQLTCETAVDDFLAYDGVSFDRILLDAPCSATGIIRRHPEIKLLRRRVDVDKLSLTQAELLNHAWNHLKPGGVLVYATCSILPQENEQVVSEFVGSHTDVNTLPVNTVQGQPMPIGRQLFPDPLGHDGFYLARLQKVKQV